MGPLRNCIRVIVVMICFCCAAISDTEAQKSAMDVILSRFPGYHVLTLPERDPDAREFIKGHFAKSNPSVVHADFDGDGRPDYALLLKEGKLGTTKLVVLLCSADTQCKTVFDVDVTASSGEVFIRPSVVTPKPANGGQGKTGQREGAGLGCFILPPPVEASLFLCASSVDRI
jgi:hypothetical protein